MKSGTAHHLPELLAPAGSCDAFFAAVSAGADAVYLSGKRFGARRSAPNFTDAELEKAIGYAHCRDVRVYVTVNTLIHDSELNTVAEYLIWLYSIGADAVLVQDSGVAALARDIVPSLPLHASTQMTLHNSAGVRCAAQQGFSRVVLARELSLPEVTRIAHETAGYGIGLEVFVHGALCYCYSGSACSPQLSGEGVGTGVCVHNPAANRIPWWVVTPISTGDRKKFMKSPVQGDICFPPKISARTGILQTLSALR
jgi:putative protease